MGKITIPSEFMMLDPSYLESQCIQIAGVEKSSEKFNRGDAVCFKSHPNIRIGTISGDFGDFVHVFTSDAYFKEFAPYGGPNTLTVKKSTIQLFDGQHVEESLPVFFIQEESNTQEIKYQWHRFDINDQSTYPPQKGNYIVSYHFPEDYNVEDYTSECNWAEYVDGELEWSPQFSSKFVSAWTYLPAPYKNKE